MSIKLALENLINEVDKKNEINNEEALVRELLEICYSNRHDCKIENLSKFNSNIFLRVYKELFKEDMESMHIIKDMICSEFLDENLQSSPIYLDDEEEIY
ncbi:hypothetical protein [uncultured Clostridium sp.]|uniref:hypothetical protein n=1 Tax=uncultured Clostridium sp. TaxID=59620 RepID=UPI0028EED82D|nr:hypothetical protein [uncultured Clostridium sp.]